jgi:hypothetical protein
VNTRQRAITIEAGLVALCTLGGFWLGVAYTRMPAVISSAAYYQGEMAPSVLLACGRGFTNLARVPDREQDYAALLAFLGQRSDRFDCADLPNDITEVPFTALQAASRYLLLAIGLTWKVSSVSWSGLSYFYGVLYATVAALAYGVARTVLGRGSSIILAAAVITSAAQLGNLPHLRDYLKVPFFLAMLLILLRVAVHPVTSRALVLWSAAAGAVIGVGFGIRFDMVVFLVFFLGAVVLLLPGSPWLQWRSRLMAVAAALAAFFATALPILLAFQLGNNSWHVVILGFADQHEAPFGLRRMYQIGTLYFDGYVAAAVNSFWQRQTGSNALFLLDSPEYGRAGAQYFREIAQTFPADLLARAWACIPAVARLAFDVVPLPVSFPESTAPDRVFDLRMAIASWFLRFVPALPLWPLIVSVGLALWNVRLSLLAVSAWLFFGAVSSLQFQGRHVVHLEVLSLLLVVVALDWVVRTARLAVAARTVLPEPLVRRQSIRGLVNLALVTTGLAVVFVVPLAALRAIQEPVVRDLFESYSAQLPKQASFSTESSGAGMVLARPSLEPPAPSSRLRTQFLAADFDAAKCPFDRVTATIRYASLRPDNNFSRPLAVTIPETGTARAWFAAYDFDDGAGIDRYGFTGLELPAAQLPCLGSLARVERVESLPLLIDAMLPPRWQQGKLYALYERWESDPINPVPRTNYTIPKGMPVRSRIGTRPVVPLGPSIDYRDPIVTIEEDGRIVARGSTNPVGYLASWVSARQSQHVLLVAEGHLNAGGLSIGLEQNRAWAALVQVIEPGPFRVAIEVPSEGEFRPVIANLSGPSRYTRFEIDRIGWLQ